MADVLTFPNGYISSCFTLNAHQARGAEFFNRFSSLNFLAKTLTYSASSSPMDVEGVDKSLPKLETSLSVISDSVNKHNVSGFLLPKFLAHDVEIRLAVRAVLFYFSYISDVSMKSSFWATFLDNAIVKEHRKRKEKVSYYANNGITPVFRDEMLLTYVKWYRTCPGSSGKFLTKDSWGEKEAVR